MYNPSSLAISSPDSKGPQDTTDPSPVMAAKAPPGNDLENWGKNGDDYKPGQHTKNHGKP